jgi:prevent-host-death family protein
VIGSRDGKAIELAVGRSFRDATSRTWSARGSGSDTGGVLSHRRYAGPMAKVITQRTLRNESGEIMRGLDRGESYIVTRNGVPVGELMPLRRREAVPAEMLLAALAGAPRIDPIRFRKDVDELIDQDPRPRV